MERSKKRSSQANATAQKAIIHQVTIMLATSKTVLFSGPNHLLTTGADYPSLYLLIIKVKGHQHQWLAGGYDLEIDIFRSG